MKKKLMGLLAAVLAVSMTTSAFAAETGFRKFIDDLGDKSGTFSANDVAIIERERQKGTYDIQFDVNCDGYFREGDIDKLYDLALKPNGVEISKTIRVKAEGARNITGQNTLTAGFVNDASLGFSYENTDVNHIDDYGTINYVFNGTGQTLEQIEMDAIDAAKKKASTIYKNLQTFKIHSNDVGKDFSITQPEGWAKLCDTLRHIIPISAEEAQVLIDNYPSELPDVAADIYAADSLKEFSDQEAAIDRMNKLAEIRSHIVDKTPETFTGDDIGKIDELDKLITQSVIAQGEDVYAPQIRQTSTEAMKMVETKYESIDISYSNGQRSETLRVGSIADSDLITHLINITTAYSGNPNLTFGDVAKEFGYEKLLDDDQEDSIVVTVHPTGGRKDTTGTLFFAYNIVKS